MLKKTIILLSMILIILCMSVISIALADTYSDYGDQVTWTAHTMNLGLMKQKAYITIKNTGEKPILVKITDMKDCSVELEKPFVDALTDIITLNGSKKMMEYYLPTKSKIKMRVITEFANNGEFCFSLKGVWFGDLNASEPFSVEFDIDDDIRTMISDVLSDENRSKLGFNSKMHDDKNQNNSSNSSGITPNRANQDTTVSTDDSRQEEAEDVAYEAVEEAAEEVAFEAVEEAAEEATEEVAAEIEPVESSEYDKPVSSSDDMYEPSGDIYDLSNYGYRTVATQGRGALVFQTEPFGSFMKEYKYTDGDQLLVNLNWVEEGYTLACDNGVYGFVDASYIDW